MSQIELVSWFSELTYSDGDGVGEKRGILRESTGGRKPRRPQGMEEEREDRSLQVVCYRAGNETRELEFGDWKK